MIEIWKDVPNYENLYKVSTLGKVFSYNKNREIYQVDNHGYKNVVLCKDGKKRSFGVHRLVALAFIPNPNNLLYINHKDENRANNIVSNLEWCSADYNNHYGNRTLKQIRSNTGRSTKRIGQYTLENILIREWRNAREASENLHINQSTIINACNGSGSTKKGKFYINKTAKGFIWKYIDN